ncbi:MAG: adenylate/guanylate cyclase domain-containing protein [Thermoleophilaceae bacterium]
MASRPCELCGAQNPAQARFCMGCGGALERRCPSCGTEAPVQARFCMGCGAALDGAPSMPDAPPEERRQVTVLFADLSGYTAMSERMDPEAVKQLTDRALRRLAQEVERYGGTVDKYIGDNVMALFGAPVAHEDDAERAVRTGLGMQAAMEEMALVLRVGVNTGEVLAGAVGDTGSYTVIGDTVNVAARLQAAGRPGSVTVGERTYAATRQAVRYQRLEPLTLKGKSQPVPAWEAEGLVTAQPVRRGTSAAESPLVGRDSDLDLLCSLYVRAADEGRPQLVTVFGEAGVGKTRLLSEFELALALRDDAPKVRQGRCLPYGSAIAYWALGEVVRGEAGIVDTDHADVAWRKLAAYIDGLQGNERIAALFARMLGIEAPADAELAHVDDPQRMRESFFSAVRWGMEQGTAHGPFVLAFEDIHWADDGMLDLIEFLAQWVRGPLLIVCLARDELLERRPSWGGGRGAATSIFLEPLSGLQARELAEALLPDGAAADLVADRSGGNPLFVEEMARLVGEGDTAGGLPDTVQAVLAARLDSLDRFERRLVQHAAVAGRTFWEGWLAAGAAEEGGDLAGALDSLQQKEIVVPGDDRAASLAGEREFAFRHVLIRDVAYGMLPKTVRSRKHFAMAGFVERQAGDRSDEVVGVIAEHYGRAAQMGSEAGLAADELEPMRAKAMRFLLAAGDGAADLYSNPEALAHYGAARELGADGDPALLADVREKEGDVSLRMGRMDAAIELWTACLDYHRGQEDLPRVGDLHRKLGAGLWHKGERRAAIEHYQRGINLLKDGPPCLELVHLYEEAASLYLHTGDNMLAVYASEKALRLAERLGETRAASRAHGIFGRVFGRIGDMAKARENLERSVELAREADPAGTVDALLALGRHLEISDADHGAARAAYEEALTLAERVGDLPAQVELHAQLAQLAGWRGDWDATLASTEASEALARREGLVGKLCFPLALRGLLAWREGAWADAEAACREAHELAEQAGWSEVSFSALFTLAMALRDAGDLTGAAGVLDRALDLCERAGFVPQSIQAMAERALVLSMAGDRTRASEAAEEAGNLAERLSYPAGRAAALEARGLTAETPEAATTLLAEAASLWSELGRPLERARCILLTAHALREHGADGWREACEEAADELGRLGLAQLADKARAEAAASG